MADALDQREAIPSRMSDDLFVITPRHARLGLLTWLGRILFNLFCLGVAIFMGLCCIGWLVQRHNIPLSLIGGLIALYLGPNAYARLRKLIRRRALFVELKAEVVCIDEYVNGLGEQLGFQYSKQQRDNIKVRSTWALKRQEQLNGDLLRVEGGERPLRMEGAKDFFRRALGLEAVPISGEHETRSPEPDSWIATKVSSVLSCLFLLSIGALQLGAQSATHNDIKATDLSRTGSYPSRAAEYFDPSRFQPVERASIASDEFAFNWITPAGAGNDIRKLGSGFKLIDTQRMSPNGERDTDTSFPCATSIFAAHPVFIAHGIRARFVVSFSNGDSITHDGKGGDGIVFVIQSDPRGMLALGNPGAGIGCEDIRHSLGSEFDNFFNYLLPIKDPDGHHVAILQNGAMSHANRAGDLPMPWCTLPYLSSNCTFTAQVQLDADGHFTVGAAKGDVPRGDLPMLIETTVKLSDISTDRKAYVGLTAGTQDAWQDVVIHSFQIEPLSH